MWIFGLVVWFVLGYFVVKYIHQNIEGVPDMLVGIMAIIIWPLTALIFFILVILQQKPDLVDNIFGESKERNNKNAK